MTARSHSRQRAQEKKKRATALAISRAKRQGGDTRGDEDRPSR